MFKIFDELKKDEPTICLLYVTPELVKLDFFKAILNDLYKKKVLRLLVIDEAHCISSWGHSFRPSFRLLTLFRDYFPETPIIALTATATLRVRNDIIKQLQLRTPNIYTCGFDRPNIRYEVRYKVTIPNLVADIKSIIAQFFVDASGIIYCQRRDSCDSLASILQQENILCAVYHAGLPQAERNSIQSQWQAGTIPLIICTIAFGMGIDKPDVRYVIHHSIGNSMEGFYQESGRAGRDRKPSLSVLYYETRDKETKEYLMNQEYEQKSQTPLQETIYKSSKESFDTLVAMCEEPICRRKQILQFFSESPSSIPDTCNNCDYCSDPKLAKKNINRATDRYQGRNRLNFSKSYTPIEVEVGEKRKRDSKESEEIVKKRLSPFEDILLPYLQTGPECAVNVNFLRNQGFHKLHKAVRSHLISQNFSPEDCRSIAICEEWDVASRAKNLASYNVLISKKQSQIQQNHYEPTKDDVSEKENSVAFHKVKRNSRPFSKAEPVLQKNQTHTHTNPTPKVIQKNPPPSKQIIEIDLLSDDSSGESEVTFIDLC